MMTDKVQVVVRVCPLHVPDDRCVQVADNHRILWQGNRCISFEFDFVAPENATQEVIFAEAGLPVIENLVSGYNSCMLAYGQTGSGKTYTMLGRFNDLGQQCSKHHGLAPRIFHSLFERIIREEEIRTSEKLKYHCTCSFLEVYDDKVHDLLDTSCADLTVVEDKQKGTFVKGLSEFNVNNVDDIMKHLFKGAANRRTSATKMNSESSRSHTVFTLMIKSQWEDSTPHTQFAQLHLVDLAGSERQKSTGAEAQLLKEAGVINQSLLGLREVVKQLAAKKKDFIPYRDFKLTRVLKDSLSGNSKIVIIATVNPSMEFAKDTRRTLEFATDASGIETHAVVNRVSQAGASVEKMHNTKAERGQVSFVSYDHYFFCIEPPKQPLSKITWEEFEELEKKTKHLHRRKQKSC